MGGCVVSGGESVEGFVVRVEGCAADGGVVGGVVVVLMDLLFEEVGGEDGESERRFTVGAAMVLGLWRMLVVDGGLVVF